MNYRKLITAVLISAIATASFFIPPVAKASVVSYSGNAQKVTFRLDKGIMTITICSADIIEVKYTNLDTLPAKTSLVVNNEWKSIANYKVTDTPAEIVLSTQRLKIKVNKATNAIRYTTIGDSILLAEDSDRGKSLTPATIAGINTYNCETRFESPSDEALFGLGCHPEDTLPINYKGRNQSMAIQYLTGAIPVLLSSKGYGILWDNYSASNFYGTEPGLYKYVSESGSMVDYYFFYGPTFDHIIASYREATGQAPLFPKWALGLFQSQDRYKSQTEVLSVKDAYRNKHIPLDCIVQDWYYWEPNVIGSHVMFAERYPDPAAMVNQLHKANLHAMISIWPVFAKGTQNFDELTKAGCMTDITWDNVVTHTFDSYYDAHSTLARQIYWREAKDSLVKRYDWDAVWVDQCEPDNGSLLDIRKQSSFATGRGIDYFNTYSLMHTTGLYTGWRKDISGKRAFFLARQAFAGQQRNAATLWSSDITCTFKAFKIQIPQGINACASGIPYWTSDIGGYHLGWKSPDWTKPVNKELFTRWFQFGAFCPIFRIHGKGERALFSNNWDDNMKAILLNYDNLRYRLMPYLYSLSWKVTSEGYTMMRALAFDFPADAAVHNIPDQYMFGPAFLVNPVTTRMYSLPASAAPVGKSRKVYLPKPAAWYDFWTGKVISGGQTIEAPAPIETLPLYIKAGSIVPMGPYMQYATEKTADTIELRIYPGADAQFVIYEDENDTYRYEKGQYATIALRWNDSARTLTIADRNGKYEGMLRKRTFQIVIVGENHGTGVAITRKADKTIVYKGKQLDVRF